MDKKKEWPFKTVSFEFQDENSGNQLTKVLINNYKNCIFMIVT